MLQKRNRHDQHQPVAQSTARANRAVQQQRPAWVTTFAWPEPLCTPSVVQPKASQLHVLLPVGCQAIVQLIATHKQCALHTTYHNSGANSRAYFRLVIISALAPPQQHRTPLKYPRIQKLSRIADVLLCTGSYMVLTAVFWFWSSCCHPVSRSLSCIRHHHR